MDGRVERRRGRVIRVGSFVGQTPGLGQDRDGDSARGSGGEPEMGGEDSLSLSYVTADEAPFATEADTTVTGGWPAHVPYGNRQRLRGWGRLGSWIDTRRTFIEWETKCGS